MVTTIGERARRYAGVQSRRQARMKREADVVDSCIPAGEIAEPLSAAVRARIVDEDDLDTVRQCVSRIPISSGHSKA
jgi:hypothetical protein